MKATAMPRKKTGYAIDVRLIEALKVLAERTGKSVNAYLEELLFFHAKSSGVLPPDAKPLGELRSGGKRTNSGRKPKDSDDLTNDATDSSAET